jgi:hypothetical protein
MTSSINLGLGIGFILFGFILLHHNSDFLSALYFIIGTANLVMAQNIKEEEAK